MQRAKSEGDVRGLKDRGDREEEEGEGGEEEEEKIEQFFAILRNYSEARNRRRMELMGELEREREAEESRRKRRRVAETDGGVGERCSSWVPRFEPEDFSADVEFRTRPLPLHLPLPLHHPAPPLPPPLAAPATVISPAKAVERERKARDDGLELKLTI
ncbi:hypothetical protein BT93_B0687 [Corymbia citriodora subsp. variegata]|nr:hypothetical protein BT93_B0687 [Corymbia citriodora subsp. variegata]